MKFLNYEFNMEDINKVKIVNEDRGHDAIYYNHTELYTRISPLEFAVIELNKHGDIYGPKRVESAEYVKRKIEWYIKQLNTYYELYNLNNFYELYINEIKIINDEEKDKTKKYLSGLKNRIYKKISSGRRDKNPEVIFNAIYCKAYEENLSSDERVAEFIKLNGSDTLSAVGAKRLKLMKDFFGVDEDENNKEKRKVQPGDLKVQLKWDDFEQRFCNINTKSNYKIDEVFYQTENKLWSSISGKFKDLSDNDMYCIINTVSTSGGEVTRIS